MTTQEIRKQVKARRNYFAKVLRLPCYQIKNFYENSKFIPSVNSATKIAAYFNVPIQQILGYVPKTNEFDAVAKKYNEEHPFHPTIMEGFLAALSAVHADSPHEVETTVVY